MRPATYKPILDCLAQLAFERNAWDESVYPVFDNRAQESDRKFADGRDAPALDVDGLRRYASDVLGHKMPEERMVLIQGLKTVVAEYWRPRVLQIPSMQPSDLVSCPDLLRKELQQVAEYLSEVLSVSTVDLHHRLQLEPCTFERKFKDLAVEMDERPPWATEADFSSLPVQKGRDGIEKDVGMVAEMVHGCRENEWNVLGPPPHNQKYDWNGVRFHHFPTSPNGGSHFEVTVLNGLVRVGWSTAHASLELGKDRGDGFPHVGYGGTGKVCVCGQYSDFGEPFGQGDTIRCKMFMRNRCWVAVFSKNGSLMEEVQLGDATSYSGALYPHITGKRDFKVMVDLAP